MAAPSNLPAVLQLPDDVLGLIVAKLSLACMFRLRPVCKQWNAILHDSNFLERNCYLAGRAPLYVWRTEEGYAAYSPESNSWHKWPTSFILMEDTWEKVWGGAHGLLLVEGKLDSDRALYLANPVTRSHRKLPPIQEVWPKGMVFDESSKSYKIFGQKYGGVLAHNFRPGDMAADVRFPNTFYVYDSEVDSWETTGEWGNGVMVFDLPTFHRGVLHCLIYALEWNPRNIRVFRLEGGQLWHRLRAAHTPRFQPFVHLFEWRGNLMFLLGRKDEDNEQYLSGVEVRQLDEEKNVWIEKMSMPDCLLRRFSPSEPGLDLDFSYQTGADYVYLTSYSEDATFVRHVICKLSTTSWWEAPELLSIRKPSSEDVRSGGLGRSFLFEPNFEKFL